MIRAVSNKETMETLVVILQDESSELIENTLTLLHVLLSQSGMNSVDL